MEPGVLVDETATSLVKGKLCTEMAQEGYSGGVGSEGLVLHTKGIFVFSIYPISKQEEY